ncbi:SLBB domain-containing protein [Deltaproteobacteria bacterium TL4]
MNRIRLLLLAIALLWNGASWAQSALLLSQSALNLSNTPSRLQRNIPLPEPEPPQQVKPVKPELPPVPESSKVAPVQTPKAQRKIVSDLSYLERLLQPGLVSGLFRNFELQVSESPEESQAKKATPEQEAEDELLDRKYLKQYGYDQLHADQFAFDPITDPALPENYRLGPGDELVIHDSLAKNTTTGEKAGNQTIVIDHNGLLHAPGVQPILAWDITLDQLNQQLSEKTKFLYVSLGELRSIQINVVGEARTPGLHRVPAIASVYNILSMVGGIKKSGSLRHIQWKRSGKLVGNVDLYGYFLRGEALESVHMKSGDTLFVPLLKKAAALAGDVRKPGIYELSEEKTLAEVIELGGGILPTSNQGRIQVERLSDSKGRTLNTLDLSTEDPAQQAVHNFDIIKIFPAPEVNKQLFTLKGPFTYEGSFELTPGLSIKQALKQGGMLREEIEASRGEILRLSYHKNRFAPEEQVISFDYNLVLADQQMKDFLIQDGDKIRLYPISRGKVTIHGEIVRNPGSYPLYENMSLKSMIFVAGGLNHRQTLDPIVRVTRWEFVDEKPTRNEFTVQINPATHETQPPLILKNGDSIFLRHLAGYKQQQFASITGEVLYPGTYEFLPGERISHLLKKAGGFTNKAFLPGAVFSRRILKTREDATDRRLNRDMDRSILQSTVEASASLTSPETHLRAISVVKENVKETNQEKKESNELAALSAAEATNQGEKNVSQKEQSKIEEINIGKLVIELKPADEFERSPDNFELMDGDSLTIPPFLNTVLVKGDTRGEASLPIKAGEEAEYYVNSLGGARSLVKLDDTYVIRPNGTVVKDLSDYVVQAGDTIVVPPDLSPRESSLLETATVVDIIFKTITTIALMITVKTAL